MASIFDGLHERVKAEYVARGLPTEALDFTTSSTYYTAFLGLVRDAPDKGKELARAILTGTYDTTKRNILEAKRGGEVVAGSRAILRKETSLSKSRLERYFCDGNDREVTLERTITYVEMQDHLFEWFNQFNVASGIRGSHGDRKTSVDLIRRNRTDQQCWDFIELKEWDSGNTLLGALVEVFRYFCGCFILSRERLDPSHGKWPVFRKARLYVLAPDKWYEAQNEGGSADLVVDSFRMALEEERHRFGAQNVDVCFHPHVAVLRGISHDQFFKMFAIYGKPFESLTFKSMLDDAAISRLKAWVDDALHQ